MKLDDINIYRRLFMEAPAMIVVLTGREGRVELVSQEAQRLHPGRDLVGLTMREAWPELEDQGYFAAVEQVFDTGRTIHQRESHVWMDRQGVSEQSERWFDLTLKPFYADGGRVLGVSAFGIDVTESVLARRELESIRQRLEFAQEAGGIGVFEWEISTDKVTWSPELEEQFQIPRGSFEGTFQGWQKRVHPDDRELTVSWVDRAVERREPLAMEFRIVWPDGSERWLLSRAKVIVDAGGAVRGLIGMSIDITERKQIERRLKDANERITRILEDILDG